MNAPIQPIALTYEQKQSPLWRLLMKHWGDRLDSLRKQNDGDKSDIETARLRGQIAAIKADLALNNDKPDLEAPPR